MYRAGRIICFCAMYVLVVYATTVHANDYGPSGGVGGERNRSEASDGQFIRRIFVRHGRRVDGIEIQFGKMENGSPSDLPRTPTLGGQGGTEKWFELHPHECIVAIAGAYGIAKSKRETATILGLTFKISTGVVHTYGISQPGYLVPSWHSPLPGMVIFRYIAEADYEISGFITQSGKELDAIGVITRQKSLCKR